jgi:large subunit ribosomal protein L21
MYAIIETGGKQFKVQAGDIINVEKLGAEAGTAYTFDRVLAILNDDETIFGAPYIDGAAVAASIIGDGKEKKLIVYKYKSKKGYHRKKGHRQPFTRVKIDAINPA